MKIKVNGEFFELENNTTLDDFIKKYEISNKLFAIELNGEVIARNEFLKTKINENDSIEVVTLCQGG